MVENGWDFDIFWKLTSDSDSVSEIFYWVVVSTALKILKNLKNLAKNSWKFFKANFDF